MSTKVRKTVTLDRDEVEFLEAESGNLSAGVNLAVAEMVGRIKRRLALKSFVEQLDDEFGEPDERDIDEFRRLLQ